MFKIDGFSFLLSWQKWTQNWVLGAPSILAAPSTPNTSHKIWSHELRRKMSEKSVLRRNPLSNQLNSSYSAEKTDFRENLFRYRLWNVKVSFYISQTTSPPNHPATENDSNQRKSNKKTIANVFVVVVVVFRIAGLIYFGWFNGKSVFLFDKKKSPYKFNWLLFLSFIHYVNGKLLIIFCLLVHYYLHYLCFWSYRLLLWLLVFFHFLCNLNILNSM